MFADARSRFEREQNAVWPSVIDLYQALVLFNAGRFFEATSPGCLSALAFFRDARAPSEGDSVRAPSGTSGVEHGATQAGASALPAGDSRHGDRIEAGVLEYQAHFLHGEIQEALGRPDIRVSVGTAVARERLETIRSVLWGDDLKIAFMKTKLAVYERLVDLCMVAAATRRDAEIFGYVEQAKSRSLRDLFVDAWIRGHAKIQSERARPADSHAARRAELVLPPGRAGAAQSRRALGRTSRSLQAQLRSREHAFIRIVREMPQGTREAVGLHETRGGKRRGDPFLASTRDHHRRILPNRRSHLSRSS